LPHAFSRHPVPSRAGIFHYTDGIVFAVILFAAAFHPYSPMAFNADRETYSRRCCSATILATISAGFLVERVYYPGLNVWFFFANPPRLGKSVFAI